MPLSRKLYPRNGICFHLFSRNGFFCVEIASCICWGFGGFVVLVSWANFEFSKLIPLFIQTVLIHESITKSLILGSSHWRMTWTRWVLSNILYFHPEPWGNDPIWQMFFNWVGSTTNYIVYKCFLKHKLVRWKTVKFSGDFFGHLWKKKSDPRNKSRWNSLRWSENNDFFSKEFPKSSLHRWTR